MWPAHSHFWVLFVENLLLTSLLISSLSAASLPDYHETLLELPNIDNNKQTEKPEIFLEELDTSRRTHRFVDLSGGDDREMKELVKQDMALQIRPSNVLTLEDETDGGDSLLRH